jgi:L-lysine exporter family protein LysE/ArgO|tara:strand:- start:83 stop:691 length:609 start_codon:yes stop_codon:yes gene_type:complete
VLSIALEGFAISLGLIVAIGAQNAFVLRQGLIRSHIFVVCCICAISDATLIAAGVLGVGAWLAEYEQGAFWISMAAIAFLVVYGILRVKSALDPQAMSISESGEDNLATVVFTTLAFTWLNPHVYLDTLVLLGSASSRYDGPEREFFGIGAALASFIFFFSLGYGARLLSPFMENPKAWRYIDGGIAIVMFTIAFTIALPLL